MKLWPKRNSFRYNLERLPLALRLNTQAMGLLPDRRVPFFKVIKEWPRLWLAVLAVGLWVAISTWALVLGEALNLQRAGALLVAGVVVSLTGQVTRVQDAYDLAAERFTFKMYADDLKRSNPKMVLPGTLEGPSFDDGYKMILAMSVRNTVVWFSGVFAVVGTLQWGYGDFVARWLHSMEQCRC